MVREKRIRGGNYVIALILTVCIFLIGVLLGVLVTEERVKYIEEQSNGQRLGYDSMQLQYLYLSTLTADDKSCGGATKTLEKNIKELEDARKKLEEYTTKSIKISDEEFRNLKRDYILSEIRYWILTSQAEKICKKNLVSVLYFYSIRGCEGCIDQGIILDSIKTELKDNILIFSFDADFEDEPMLDILKEGYNITKLPAVVLEGRKFEGVVSKAELLKIACSYYKENVDVCKE